MPILLLGLALFFPRAIIFILWLFTTWFNNLAIDWIIGLLGFLFMPYTFLWYTVVLNWYGGVWGMWQLIFLALAIVTDIAHFAGWGYWYSYEE